MAPVVRIAGLGLAVALFAGCGSSSHAPPRGGLAPGGWQVISQGTHNRGATVGKATGTAINALRLRMQVNSTPNVATSTTYQVHCGDKTTYGKSVSGHTPLTRELTIPTGGGSQDAHGTYCDVIGSATKPADAEMTVTLLERPAPTP